MKKISILHLSQVSGGVEQYIKLFLKYSNNEKFDNYLVAPNLDNYKGYRIKKSLEFNTNQSFSIIKLLKNILFIRKILKEIKPDIVYLHSTFAGVIGRLAAVGCNCKVIYNPHGWSFKMKVSLIKRIIYKSIESVLSLLTDKLILISKSEYDAAKKIVIKSNKLELVYNGIDTELNPKDNKLHITIPDNKYVIGMVGRISEQKNPLFFLEFAKLISKNYPNTLFIIVGAGELEQEVNKRIIEYGLSEKFLITGWVSNPEDYISLFDQAVLFSKWEGFGFAVAEYMLHKKPVIITDVDGMSELITDNYDGLKIKLGNLEDACLKSNMIRNNLRLANKLGENALNTVLTSFSAKDKIERIEKLFTDLVGKQ